MSKKTFTLLLRFQLLFFDFLLIIAAVYQLKPASRSFFIDAVGSEHLPYVWIATALALWAIISVYYRLIARFSRLHVVIATILIMQILLLLFHSLLATPSAASAFAFYIFVDILSVILVEQFWSLTNSIYTEGDGKRWYGLIATGGLAGGVAGGMGASMLITRFELQTVDLLYIAMAILLVLVVLTLLIERAGLYQEVPGAGDSAQRHHGGWRIILEHRYLLLITSILLLAQIIEPLVEFQFMRSVEDAVADREARTAYLGQFFSMLSFIAIAINVIITPVVHRWLGVIGGLSAQPLAVAVSSIVFMGNPGLSTAAALKIADRGLSYSINRASKELLYVPIDPLLIYQAKSWIDMFGYRLFRVLGSVMILLLTQWLPFTIAVQDLVWPVLGVCLLWGGTLVVLKRENARVSAMARQHIGRYEKVISNSI